MDLLTTPTANEIDGMINNLVAQEGLEVLLHGLDAAWESHYKCVLDRSRNGSRQRGEGCLLEGCGEQEMYDTGCVSL